MRKTTRFLVSLMVYTSITACANRVTKQADLNGAVQWDFDHRVQFIQTKLKNNKYQLEIIPRNKTGFEQLSMFLLRKSYSLCGSYHYKIEMIQGIEDFDDKRVMPNYITPSLIAKVAC